MYDPSESTALQHSGIRTGSACDPDDGSGAACFVGDERYVAVEYEARAGDAGRASYIEDLRRG